MMVTGRNRAEVALGIPLDDETANAYSKLCKRRVAGEPLQYIEGLVPFGGAAIAVDPRVLIPRPETEYLWELAATLPEKSPAVVVDLCTGSGALAVGLAMAYTSADVVGCDISADALEVARANSIRNEVDVRWFQGDLFEALPEELAGRVDLLVSNPPYVADSEMSLLPEEVRSWEPGLALAAGPHGLAVISGIAGEVGRWLAPGGWIFIEIGESHGTAALALFDDSVEVELRRDLTGRDRYVVGRRR